MRQVRDDACDVVHRHSRVDNTGSYYCITKRNYLGIGFTRLGKMLISLSSILMAESVLMTFIYYIWALNGLGLLVSLPIMVMTLINVIAVTILYLISKM